MGIPKEVKAKLDTDPSWAIQHEDIIQVMEEGDREKPWSRYMIQRHLEGSPAKKTVQDRLDELVELEVLDRYAYSNQTLYDLSYNPIVSPGGRLKDANLMEILTLRDRSSIRDLGSAAMMSSLLFLGLGILTEFTFLKGDITLTGNIYFNTAIVLYLFSFAVLIGVGVIGKVESVVLDNSNQGSTD